MTCLMEQDIKFMIEANRLLREIRAKGTLDDNDDEQIQALRKRLNQIVDRCSVERELCEGILKQIQEMDNPMG